MRNITALVATLALIGTPVASTVCLTASPAQNAIQPLALPPTATALEGVPQVRVDVTREKTQRRELGATEAAGNRLRIRVDNGQLAWSSRGNSPLMATRVGEFTYLLSSEPGHYVRIRRIDDRLTYVEHVDTDTGSVTYWGELRVVVGK